MGYHDYSPLDGVSKAMATRGRLYLPLFVISVVLCVSLSVYNHQLYSGFVQQYLKDTHQANTPSIYNVKNRTLGFSKVFALGFPERSDKRDAVILTASETGFDVEWIDGVHGDSLPQKALPAEWSPTEEAGTLGCWRAHMNAIQKMIRDGTPTALLMEDDVDWDVMLKSQLLEFARGTRYLQGESENTGVEPNSPYGDDWDLLWLGTCGSRNREDVDQKYYVIHDDPTAVPQDRWGYRARQPNLTPPALTGNFTRVVYEPVRGLCTFSYALSLRGAKKLLYHQSLLGHGKASDRALQTVCNERFLGFKCFAPFPSLIHSHKAIGPTGKDSDRIDSSRHNGGFRTVGETWQIVYSTRLNLGRLVEGSTSALSQWPESTLREEIDITMDIPRGKGVFVKKDEYGEYERAA